MKMCWYFGEVLLEDLMGMCLVVVFWEVSLW